MTKINIETKLSFQRILIDAFSNRLFIIRNKIEKLNEVPKLMRDHDEIHRYEILEKQTLYRLNNTLNEYEKDVTFLSTLLQIS